MLGGASLTADNCTFYNNTATSTGADIYGISYKSIVVTNSVFSHSSSSISLFHSRISARIENSTFSSYVTASPIFYVQ